MSEKPDVLIVSLYRLQYIIQIPVQNRIGNIWKKILDTEKSVNTFAARFAV